MKFDIDYGKRTMHKLTKRDFEKMLVDSYGYDNITACPYDEQGRGMDADKRIHMTLYYLCGEHVGTWVSKLQCWTWEVELEKVWTGLWARWKRTGKSYLISAVPKDGYPFYKLTSISDGVQEVNESRFRSEFVVEKPDPSEVYPENCKVE